MMSTSRFSFFWPKGARTGREAQASGGISLGATVKWEQRRKRRIAQRGNDVRDSEKTDTYMDISRSVVLQKIRN